MGIFFFAAFLLDTFSERQCWPYHARRDSLYCQLTTGGRRVFITAAINEAGVDAF